MSLYVQLTKLEFNLGGVMLHSGSFLAPLQEIINGKPVPAGFIKPPKENLRFLIYHGEDDHHFKINKTIPAYEKLFLDLGINHPINRTVIVPKIEHEFSPEGS